VHRQSGTARLPSHRVVGWEAVLDSYGNDIAGGQVVQIDPVEMIFLRPTCVESAKGTAYSAAPGCASTHPANDRRQDPFLYAAAPEEHVVTK
jgi:hypothetical protein